MRIWLDPNKLQARGLMPQDVISAIQQQSQQVAAGQVGMPPAPQGQDFQYTLNVNGRLDDAERVRRSSSRRHGKAALTRLRDVGRVELARRPTASLHAQRQPAAGMAIYQLPGANALDVGRRVKARWRARARLPAGLAYASRSTPRASSAPRSTRSTAR
jgi:HAE1 family hydrophobic/amphiphilic exporter-1